MRIVVFKLNHLGDNVVFVPAIQALRERLPDAQITIVTTHRERELYEGPLGPQEILLSQKQAFDKSYRRPWMLALWLLRIRARCPQACLVSFDQGTVAHLVAKHSGAKVRVGGNLDRIRVSDSLTEIIPIPADGRPVSWNWSMAKALSRTLGDAAPWPEAPPPPNLSHLLPRGPKPKGSRKRVVVHSGASRAINRWPGKDFSAVASSLADDFEVVWITHGGTTGTAPAGTISTPVDSLSEFSEWVAGSDLFLGNNSGPMHFANALGCSGVVVTGPSALGWNPFWYPERWTILRHPDLYCAPCEKPSVALEGCTNLETPMACLNYWSKEKVEDACRKRLADSREDAR
jgi:heptosyltransferase-2